MGFPRKENYIEMSFLYIVSRSHSKQKETLYIKLVYHDIYMYMYLFCEYYPIAVFIGCLVI